MDKDMSEQQDNQTTLEYFSKALQFSFVFLKIIVGTLVLYYLLFSGFFTVRQDEVAIVLRWGRITGIGADRLLQPGFHWSFPEPIDKIIRIPVKKVKSIEIGEFWSANLDEPNAPRTEFLVPYLHGYCITGDNNIIHTKWHVEYRIGDPVFYLTRIENEKQLITDVVCNTMIETVGSLSVDEALRTKLEKMSRLTRQKAQAKLDAIDSGIILTGVYLNRSVPPLQTVAAFNSVLRAEQTKSSETNEAQAYANKILNMAQGEASEIISSSKTYKNEVVNESRADAEYIQKLTRRFKQGSKQLNTYLAYFYQEKIEDIFSALADKFILRKPVPQKENELRIILGRETNLGGNK